MTRNPNTGRPRSSRGLLAVLLAVLVLALVLGLGVLVGTKIVGGGTSSHGLSGSKSSPSRKHTSKAVPVRPASDSVCGLPNGNQQVPTSAPQATWTATNPVAVPSSPEIGPGKTTGKVGSCFAHNPTGALFAFANFMGDATFNDADPHALADRYANGPDKAAAVYQIMHNRKGSQAQPAQIVGFRFDDSTPDRVTIEIAIRVTQGPNAGGMASLTFALTWQNGDWRLVVPNGGANPPTTALSNLDGFIKWSGATR